MSTVYLPVEVSKRELLARGFLSTRLAAAGCSVVVFKSDLFHRVGWPGPGIYIGKNFLQPPPPHSIEKLEQMRAAGVVVFLLDEEGGIYPGGAEAEWADQLKARYDPFFLQDPEKYLVWGEWQRRVAEAQVSGAQVEVTGSPNFDLYQSKYAPSLAPFDQKETEGLSDFVLLNTRFVFANALNDGGNHFIHHGHVAQEVPLSSRYRRLASDGIRFYQFIGLVQKLSEALPDQLFVLRPHPNENATSYESILAVLPNVKVIGRGDVGSWIRRCRCLIHNGCTTAIQAEIAGKKVISYIAPPEDDVAIPSLPNSVGYLARSDEDVLRAIADDSPPPQEQGWSRTIGKLDAIEEITNLVTSAPKRYTCPEIVRRRARMFEVSELPRKLKRLFSPTRRAEAEKLRAHFDPTFFQAFPEIVRCAETHYGAAVNVHQLSTSAFVVEPCK